MTCYRRGFSLVELVLAFALALAALGTTLALSRASDRRSRNLEAHSGRIASVDLIRECLAWDLLRALPFTELPEADRPGIQASESLIVPVVEGPLPGRSVLGGATGRLAPWAGQPRSLVHHPLCYRFHAPTGTLYRAGRPLVRDLDRVTFRLTGQEPQALEVTVVTKPRPPARASEESSILLLPPTQHPPARPWRFHPLAASGQP